MSYSSINISKHCRYSKNSDYSVGMPILDSYFRIAYVYFIIVFTDVLKKKSAVIIHSDSQIFICRFLNRIDNIEI